MPAFSVDHDFVIEASTVPTSLLGSDFFLSFETDPLENPSDSSTLVHRTSFSSSSSSPRLGPLFRDERLSVAVAVPRHSPPPEPPSPRRERAASIPSVSSSQHPDSSFPLLPLLLPGWGSSSPPPCRLYPRRPRRLERERDSLFHDAGRGVFFFFFFFFFVVVVVANVVVLSRASFSKTNPPKFFFFS